MKSFNTMSYSYKITESYLYYNFDSKVVKSIKEEFKKNNIKKICDNIKILVDGVTYCLIDGQFTVTEAETDEVQFTITVDSQTEKIVDYSSFTLEDLMLAIDNGKKSVAKKYVEKLLAKYGNGNILDAAK